MYVRLPVTPPKIIGERHTPIPDSVYMASENFVSSVPIISLPQTVMVKQ